MKPSFWISSVGVTGHHTKPDSIVHFRPGLNVIRGKSDTGKSWVLQCIDYAFGKDPKDFPITDAFGYRNVRMTVRTDQGGQLTIARPIGAGHTTVEVTSSDTRIESKQYKTTRTKASTPLSSVWLKLIGFDHPDNMRVVANKSLQMQAFTWRTILQVLYATEDNISTKQPILKPENGSPAPLQSALAVLIADTDLESYAQTETAAAKKMKNNAVIEYLAPLPERLSGRIQLLERTIGTDSAHRLQERINQLETDAAGVQTQLEKWTEKGQLVLGDLQGVRDQLVDLRMLQRRYKELASSYQARIDRFDFVVEGHVLLDPHHVPDTCPTCSQDLPDNIAPEFAEPQAEERQTLEARLADLRVLQIELAHEEAPLVERESTLHSESEQIAAFINASLLPRLSELKAAITDHNALIAAQTEYTQLEAQREDITSELTRRRNLEFKKTDFNVLTLLPEQFWDGMSAGLLNTLGACAFPNLREAYFSREIFDAVVNKKRKTSDGQGYRSFVNTAVMLTLRSFLASGSSSHNPGLLMIDTPLLGLDDPQLDPELKKERETIPQALYEYLVENQDAGQVIIVDNDKYLPDMTELEGRCHVERFTKNLDEGRYGFLLETTDKYLADEETSADD